MGMCPFACNSLFLAAFHHLADSFGGFDYCFTEMVSAGAYVSGSPYGEFYTITEPKSTHTINPDERIRGES